MSSRQKSAWFNIAVIFLGITVSIILPYYYGWKIFKYILTVLLVIACMSIFFDSRSRSIHVLLKRKRYVEDERNMNISNRAWAGSLMYLILVFLFSYNSIGHDLIVKLQAVTGEMPDRLGMILGAFFTLLLIFVYSISVLIIGRKKPLPGFLSRVRELREQSGGMTQQALAEKVAVTRETIEAIESAAYNPSLMLSFKIASVFGKPITEVFQFESARN